MEHSLNEIFENFNRKIAKFERRILDHVDTEVSMRMSLRTNSVAQKLSKTYGIPVESLIQDMTEVGDHFCKGIKGDKTRCLKTPKDNGYCGFHQKQVPIPVPKRHERIPCPWEQA
jgi:hypothetical protein